MAKHTTKGTGHSMFISPRKIAHIPQINCEKQKLVFMMRYYDDLPYEEISKIVDMSVGTLKTNYHYAKQKIEEYIKENYER